jgi:hypothetical protein
MSMINDVANDTKSTTSATIAPTDANIRQTTGHTLFLESLV